MTDNNVFMSVNELGDLYLYDVLLSYIYPRVFVCIDKYDCHYLFYEMSSKNDIDIWLVSKITKREFYSLADRKIPIQKVYKKKKLYEIFSITQEYADIDRIKLTYDADKWIEKLPKENVYVDSEFVADEYDETLNSARETGCTTFDIKLFSGTTQHSISTTYMADICTNMNGLSESIYGLKRRDEKRINVSTAVGSCVIRFTFPDQPNLFDEYNSVNELNVINEVLSSNNFINSISSIKDKNKFIRSYSGLINTIKKTNSEVQFTTAFPNSNKVKKIDMSNSLIKNIYKEVKDIYTLGEETRTFVGSLIALDINKKKFKLKVNDKIISGTVDEKILCSSSYEIPKSYTVQIRVIKFIDENKNCKEEKYMLTQLA